MHAVFTCPTTVGHSFAEILLFNIAFTAGSMLQISAYPPRMPHSPIYPLEQDINDAAEATDLSPDNKLNSGSGGQNRSVSKRCLYFSSNDLVKPQDLPPN